jgi:hypothetical protein
MTNETNNPTPKEGTRCVVCLENEQRGGGET